MLCYYDGEFRPFEECRLPLSDMAIERGIAAFDSMRIYDGIPFRFDDHIKRLEFSCKYLNVKQENFGIIDTVRQKAREFLASDNARGFNGYIKTSVTGGDINNKGHFPAPRFCIVFEPHKFHDDADRAKGFTTVLVNGGRPLPQIKTTCYSVGFHALAAAPDCDESIYVENGTDITEGLISSFFMVKDGHLITAPLTRVLESISRAVVLQVAEENGIKVELRCPQVSEVATADEAFFAGSGKEIMPIVKINDTVLGNGKPGKLSLFLQQKFHELVERELQNS